MPIAALRVARVLLALLMMMVAVGARAEDPPQPEQRGPAASAPTGERGSSTAHGTATPASPAVAEQHKLPPDSTTKQTLDLPGRTLSFTATTSPP